MLEARGLKIDLGGREVLHGVDLAVAPGTLTVVFGPNGAGKSTLLRALAGHLLPSAGEVLLDGHSIASLPAAHFARRVAFCRPSGDGDLPFTVRELVATGRYPLLGWWGRPGAADRRAVDEAIERLGISHLADRPVSGLSAGERQRAVLAAAVAQESPILVADEPESHLDPPGQGAVYALFAELAAAGSAVVAAGHQINAAAPFADRVLLIADGRAVTGGAPGETLNERSLHAAFGPGLRIVGDGPGAPLVVPEARQRALPTNHQHEEKS
jgi:iron complex transport system ATP-binding protein